MLRVRGGVGLAVEVCLDPPPNEDDDEVEYDEEEEEDAGEVERKEE